MEKKEEKKWFEIISFYSDRDCPIRDQQCTDVLFATCKEIIDEEMMQELFLSNQIFQHIFQLMENGEKIRRRDIEKAINIQIKKAFSQERRRVVRKWRRQLLQEGKSVWDRWKTDPKFRKIRGGNPKHCQSCQR